MSSPADPSPADPSPSEPRPSEPRPADEPVRDEDLVTLRLAQRATRRDVHRLADLADGLATGTERFSERRALAFGEWVERVCVQIATQQEAVRDLLWPALERHGGAAVDLSGLRDDHRAIAPVLDEVRRAARIVVASLMVRPAAVATHADFARMRGLAVALRSLAELVDEHYDDSDREVCPVLVEYVPRAEWRRVEAAMRRRCTDLGFILPWLAGAARPDELPVLRARLGRITALMVDVRTARVRRRERVVFSC